MYIQNGVERRVFERFKVSGPAYAALGPELDRMGHIINISRSGLAFSYIKHASDTPILGETRIQISDNADILCDMPFISISDTGCGMSKDVLNKIFEPYFTTKEKGKGTGMGLSVVHGLVHNLGGIIDVSTTLGKGSCFTVYLPLASSLPRHDTAENRQSIKKGKGRILLVDDERSIVSMEQKILESDVDLDNAYTSQFIDEIYAE